MERRLNFKYQTTEQNDPFESALSSMVSSPTGERSNGGDFILGGCDHGMMMELIGRLGCMSESTTANNSTNTSCYTTPLNSPPKVSSISSYMIMAGGGSGGGVNLPNFHADPGFVERAAKFSSFGLNRGSGGGGDRSGVNLECGKLSGSSLDHGDVGDSREGSSVSEQNHVVGQMGLIDGNCRKRKSFSKSKAKDNDNKAEQEDEKSNAKRSKANYEEGKKQNGGECDNNNNNNNNNSKEVAKAEPAKDYIHVRARRGQATDSHSLAERVRREKISERMKFLQDLVPGCNKVIGKATVLDEIINYVQSLQHQVEFLSMKLATFNPRIEFNPQNLVSKHVMFESKGQIMYKLEQTSAQPFTHNYQPFQHFPNGNEHPFSTNPSIPLTCSITGFGDSITQMPNFWENDLQSIVQMGILQNQTQSLPGTSPNAPMKVEL